MKQQVARRRVWVVGAATAPRNSTPPADPLITAQSRLYPNTVTRIVTPQISEALGQQLIDNRSGPAGPSAGDRSAGEARG